MSSSEDPKPIPGSERIPLPGAEIAGPADPHERIQISVQVRPRSSGMAAHAMDTGNQPLGERQYLSREELAAQHGADPQDLAKVEAFAKAHGLEVIQSSVLSRTVKLSGTIGDLSAAFGVQLQLYKAQDTTYRGRTGPVHVPSELADIVTGVLGLDNRPVARPHYHRLQETKTTKKPSAARKTARPEARIAPLNLPGGGFTAPMVAQLYDFPAGVNGTGQCIGIIELGGGYQSADLNAYFSGLGMAVPQVNAISVDGAANTPAGNVPGSPDVEVCLDIEVAGAVAPGASIAVYFAPNTTAGFVDAVNAALQDTVNNPAVISISWGLSEDYSTGQFRTGMDQAFQNAASLGVSVCVASGDHGSSDGVADGQRHVDFPASSPFALACGGTELSGTGSTISSEVTWNENNGWAGGGGASGLFPRPPYQAQVNVPTLPTGFIGRGVPDVAGNASGRTGYQVVVFAQSLSVGGTSAVAPLWAGLIALINQSLASQSIQRAGFLNPLIYSNPGAFNDIVQGNNDINGLGVYAAGAGWDACTGLGTPNGAELLNVLSPVATITWTPPTNIVYGTPLGSAQLDATASEPGSFVYSPAAGTILTAGTHTLSVTFTPTNPTRQSVSASVQINVLKATPSLNWANPPAIVYGTVLGAAQLDATSSIPGIFSYTPAGGTVLTAGVHTLSVLFTPNDTADYTSASANVQLTVLKATPVVSWATPADIDFGTALGPAQLNATASVPGTLTYAPPAGTVLSIGLSHTLMVLFSPSDTLNYNPSTATVQLNVLHGYPVIMSVTFSPTWVRAGHDLQVEVVVKNDSVNPHMTEGPDPGFVYNEGDTYETKGPPLIPGAYRIGVDLEHSPYAVRNLYRWGFGHTLAPGETLTLRGYIHFNDSNQHNGAYYAAMIEEPNHVIQDRQGTTFITIFGQPD